MNRQRLDEPAADSRETQIEAWRAHLQRSRAVTNTDAEELEDHLREQIASLGAQGLSEEEAFLVAVRRMGAVDALTREFAREHSDRLWKQLVLSGNGAISGAESSSMYGSRKMWVALGLAVAAGVAIKLPALFGIWFDTDQTLFYPVNISFFILPFIVAFFAWERPLPTPSRVWLAAAFVLTAMVVNALTVPWLVDDTRAADTHFLTILHLPIALWLAVGAAYVGGGWRGASVGWISSASPTNSSSTSS